jgi:hypothetical protein
MDYVFDNGLHGTKVQEFTKTLHENVVQDYDHPYYEVSNLQSSLIRVFWAGQIKEFAVETSMYLLR